MPTKSAFMTPASDQFFQAPPFAQQVGDLGAVGRDSGCVEPAVVLALDIQETAAGPVVVPDLPVARPIRRDRP
jgi:hypothetical protein